MDVRQCLDVDIEVQNQALALDGLEFGCLDGLDISPWNRTTMPRDIWPPLREPAYNTEPSRSEFGWNRVFPPPTARTPSLALVKNKSYCLSRGTEGTPGAALALKAISISTEHWHSSTNAIPPPEY